MYNIAVMGDRDSIYGYAALGLNIFPVSDEVEGRKVLKKLLFSPIFSSQPVSTKRRKGNNCYPNHKL